jgi:cytoskeletal protein RodZ
MSRENEWEAHEAELASLLQQALRRETPPGLSEEQRALLSSAVRRAERPRWLARSAAFVAVAACALLLWVAYADKQERAQREQAALRAHAAEQRAQREREEQRAAGEAEREAAAQRAAQAARASACDRERARTAAARAPSEERPPRAGKAAPGKASDTGNAGKAGGASASCDPNDPLCGL